MTFDLLEALVPAIPGIVPFAVGPSPKLCGVGLFLISHKEHLQAVPLRAGLEKWKEAGSTQTSFLLVMSLLRLV